MTIYSTTPEERIRELNHEISELRAEIARLQAELAASHKREAEMEIAWAEAVSQLVEPVAIPDSVHETLSKALSLMHNELYSSHRYAQAHPEEVEALKEAGNWLAEQQRRNDVDR